jgi:cytochrome c biogenesis protein CcmG, thiol:disulfide interchange protein DsbE
MLRISLTRHFYFSLSCCLLFAAALFSAPPVTAQDNVPKLRFVRDPDPAPALDLKDLDGKPLKLDAYRGKVILLNFWATWCGPCRAEIPSLIELQKRYKDRLQVIGLAVDEEDDSAVQKFAASESINYPVAMTPPEIRVAYGGIMALPTVFVINPEGRIVQKHVGLFNPALYEMEVRALLDLPVAARIETFQDDGEIFLKHADRATTLPGVDLSKLAPEQRAAALHKFNAEDCTCGCKFTLAQCRIYDPACQTSQQRTTAIVKEVSSVKVNKTDTTAPDSAAPASPER